MAATADDKVSVNEYKRSDIEVVYQRLFEANQMDIPELVECVIKTIQEDNKTNQYLDADRAIQLLKEHPEYIFAYVYMADQRLKIRQILCDICKRSLICPMSPISHCICRGELPITDQFDACIECITMQPNLTKHVSSEREHGCEHNLMLGTMFSIWCEYYADFMEDIVRTKQAAVDTDVIPTDNPTTDG